MRVLLSVLLLLSTGVAPLQSQNQDKQLQSNPANDLFDLALLAYQEALATEDEELRSANFEAALRQFSRFLQHHEKHGEAIKAWYYSAICHDKLGRQEDSLRCLRTVVATWKKGTLVGAAALQIANHEYEAEQFEKAAEHFLLAIKESNNQPTRQLARYRRALCFQKLQQTEKTIAALEEILADQDSPYLLQAEQALAHFYRNTGKKESAFTLFRKLARSEDQATRSEAVLQSALLARDLGYQEETTQLFEEILTTPGLERWQGEAQLFLMSTASQAKEFPRVLELFKQARFPLKKDQQIKRLLLAIQAMESTGRTEETTPLYQELEHLTPDTQAGFEAAYILLSRLYQQNKPREFVEQARRFLKTYTDSRPEDPFLDNTRLMLAETEFAAQRFREAAQLYEAIHLDRLASDNHAGVRFRLLSSYRKTGEETKASAALEDFLQHHSKDPRAATALAQRGDSALARKDFSKALRDYDHLLTLTQDPRLVEYAWAQKAETFRKQKDLPSLISAHQHLLQTFPKRLPPTKAASWFWIGWAQFRLEDFESCLQPFAKARSLHAESFDKESSVHLALAHYSLEHLEELQHEVDRLHRKHPSAHLPRPLYAWLGVQLVSSDKPKEAWDYLPDAVNWNEQGETPASVWLALAQSAMATEHFRQAIRAYDLLLAREQHAFHRASHHYQLAVASLALEEFSRAQKEAEAALELKPQGKLNGQIRLILGDLARAQKDSETALQHYVVVAELFNEDPATLQQALQAAIEILENKGDPDALAQSQRYRKQLKSP